MDADSHRRPEPLAFDYDRDPDRFRTGRRTTLAYASGGDVHEQIAARLIREGTVPVLDVGCGDGALGRPLVQAGVPWIGLDFSATLLRDAPRPAVRAEATRLPFPDDTFGAVAML